MKPPRQRFGARRPSLGMTLLEVLVTLAVLGLLTSVATLAPRPLPSATDELRRMVEDSLSAAITQRRTIIIAAHVGSRTISATVSPDGRVVADSAFHTSPSADAIHVR